MWPRVTPYPTGRTSTFFTFNNLQHMNERQCKSANEDAAARIVVELEAKTSLRGKKVSFERTHRPVDWTASGRYE